MAKIAWIVGGAALIWFTAIGVGSGFEIGFVAALVLTLLFWGMAIGLQMAIGVRLSRTAQGERRFGISTILLIMAYFAVYLVPIRAIFAELQGNATNMPWHSWVVFTVFLGVGAVVLSAFQLVFAEALVTLGVRVQRWLRSRRPSADP